MALSFSRVMRRAYVFPFLSLLLTFIIFLVTAQSASSQADGCRLSEPAFCDTFDVAHPDGRAGDLDESAWSVARLGGGVNPSQREVVRWAPATLNLCQNFVSVVPSADFGICNSHFMEAMNDAGNYQYIALRGRQPFDFRNRLGTIVFDVDAKSAGHAWWIEVWVVDQPIPGPNLRLPGSASVPRNGIGFVFGPCSDGDTGLIKVAIVEDYVESFAAFEGVSCFQTEDNNRNHLSIQVGRNEFRVWASDPGEVDLREIAWSESDLHGWDLPFSRGYVNLLHVQYNAEKSGHDPNQTYHWDNIGWDGPTLARPVVYEIPNANIEAHDDRAISGTVNLGYLIDEEANIRSCCEIENEHPEWVSFSPFVVEDVVLAGAAEAYLNLNLWYFTDDRHLFYRFNGGRWHEYSHPFPESTDRARALSIPVSLDNLRNGTNTLQLRPSQGEIVVANMELEVGEQSRVPSDYRIMLPLLWQSR